MMVRIRICTHFRNGEETEEDDDGHLAKEVVHCVVVVVVLCQLRSRVHVLSKIAGEEFEILTLNFSEN